MGEYDSGPRPLPWELRNAVVFSRTTEDDDCEPAASSFVWPEDSDEKTLVLFSLSLNEYNVLASAIDVGSDIAYGEDALRVLALWLRNERCNVPICAAIAECINTDDDVQENIIDMLERSDEFKDFLSDYINEHPNGIEMPINEPIPVESRLTITQPEECDYDKLWAQCKGVVTTADAMIKQFFVSWADYITEGSVISAMTRDVPLIRNLALFMGLGGVAGYASLLVSSIGALYAAAADDTYKAQLACELFCLAKPNCYLVIQDVRDLLNIRTDEVLGEFNNADIVMQVLATLDLTGRNVADIYMTAFFNILGSANLVWPDAWGFDGWLYAMSTFSTPDNSWETDCPDCPEIVCYDLKEGAAGFYACNVFATADAQFGSWIDGEGLAPGPVGQAFYFRHAAGSQTSVASKVTLKFNMALSSIFVRYNNGSFTEISVGGTSIELNEGNMPDMFPYDAAAQSFDITPPDNAAPSDDFRVIRMCYEIAP